jgi:mRNA-degrading endonuclease RelE of RelBE toxin-antitoxin system
MRLDYTERFLRAYGSAPTRIQQTFDKQADYLVQDIRHPSLRAKKYNEAENIWQARVNRDWRFYFQIESGTYVLLDIIKHPK